jgi:hypothetical protein
MEPTQGIDPALLAAAQRIDADVIFGRGEVLTPPIEALVNAVVEWIHIGLPGNSIFGPRRAGKTYALRYLESTLSQALGYPVVTVRWCFPDDKDEIRPKAFLQIALSGSDCEQIVHRDMPVLIKRLVDTLKDRMQVAMARRLIVMVDEAQVLSMANYMQMVYLHNLFERAGLYPYFIVTGQPELTTLRSTWESAKAHHITGRFFVQEHPFTCVAQNDLERVLDCFDEPAKEGDPSPVGAVLSQAYASGFRLRHAAGAFRTALGILEERHNLGQKIPMPMSYLRISAAALVRLMAMHPYRPDMVSDALVMKCFQASNFITHMSEYVELSLPTVA